MEFHLRLRGLRRYLGGLSPPPPKPMPSYVPAANQIVTANIAIATLRRSSHHCSQL